MSILFTTRAVRCGAPVLAAFAWLSGCTVINKWDVEQCKKDHDCGKHGAQYSDYVCVDNLCRAFLSCTSDAQCQTRGGSLKDYICSDQKCVAPDCTTNDDCLEDSDRPTAVCMAGRCADPNWGCLDSNDEPSSPPTIKFTTAVQDLNTRKAPAGMKAFVCASTDKACASPIAGPFQATDTAGNISFSITGLTPVGFAGFIKFTSTNDLPLEFQFVKTPLTHDFTSPPTTPFAMVPPHTMEMFGVLAGKDVDETNSALLVMRVYDCEDKPAAGIKLTATRANSTLDQTFFFTSDDTYMPNVDATATDTNGVAGLANVPKGSSTINVIHAASGYKLYDFSLTANPSTFILVFIHAKDIRL
jgi:hypothetical protein